MKKLLFLTTLFVGMAYAGIAFMSCSKDDDNTDSSSANLEGCWKLTKSVDNFSGEEQVKNSLATTRDSSGNSTRRIRQ